MKQTFPQVYLVRHGETTWSISGQHTGRTDIALTERGERAARELRARLKDLNFAKIFTSPLQRSQQTAELAGFGESAVVDPDLMEWDYGDYESRRTVGIRKKPDWLSSHQSKFDQPNWQEKNSDHPDQTPGNNPSIGGVKVVTESGWFAARPFGIENIYKIYVESFRGHEHLRSIAEEAQTMVDDALA